MKKLSLLNRQVHCLLLRLDDFAREIYGKNVVCILSGSNNDIDRMPEIKERSLQYEGLKHYFLIKFAQRPGALKEFVNNVLVRMTILPGLNTCKKQIRKLVRLW